MRAALTGALRHLMEVIAAIRVNIVETSNNRAFCGISLGHIAIDLTMETKGREHVEALAAALTEAGYEHGPVA